MAHDFSAAGGGAAAAPVQQQVPRQQYVASVKIRMKTFGGSVSSCSYSPDGKFIAAGTDGKSNGMSNLTVLSATTGETLIVKDHPKVVFSVCFSSDSKRVVTGCEDGIVRVFNVNDGACMSSRDTMGSGYALSVALLTALGSPAVLGTALFVSGRGEKKS